MKTYDSHPMNKFMTLVELLHWRAINQPNQRACTYLVDGETEEIHLTYAELDQSARSVCALLQKEGADGERVLLLYPPGLAYISGFLGCLYAGATAVPAYPPHRNRPDARLQAIIKDAQVTLVLTTSSILANIESRFTHMPELATLRWFATDDGALDLAEASPNPNVNSDTLAFLQYTSGSTATPKGVMLTHGNLLHNLALIHDYFDHTVNSLGVIWLPPYHDMGLIGGILQPLYGGFPVVLMSPTAFLQKPVRWLQAISRYRATTSGGPSFAYEYCASKITPEELAALDLSSWDVAFNGAEPVRAESMEHFAKIFAACGFRHEAFYPCYGLAEATLIVSGGVKSAPPVLRTVQGVLLEKNLVAAASADEEDARRLVGNGQARSGQKIMIVDPHALLPCAADQVGEIWVSGNSVAQGYWNKPEETTHTFQAYVAHTEEGPFLRTGDLGFLKDDELFVTGRIKDLIIIRGRNHYPQDIEFTVERSHEALQPGGGAAFTLDSHGGQQLVIVHELKRTHRHTDIDEVVTAVRQAVAEEHDLQVHAVVLVKPMSIPKTSSGKIQRYACRTGFLEESLQVIGRSVLEAPSTHAPATQSEHGSFIRRALTAVEEPASRRALLMLYLQEEAARVLRLPSSQIDPQQPLNMGGLDSLTAVELQHKVEIDLDVVLPMVDFLQGTSIAQLTSQILTELTVASSDPLPMLIARSQEETAQSPLSYGQRSIWFLQRLDPENTAYNIARAVRIQIELDIAALRQAFQALLDRHSALRTTFPAPHGEPVQHIHHQAEVFFQAEDASTWGESAINERLSAKAHHPFDLAQGPLLRVYLFSRSPHEHILLLVVHHIVVDFWSLALLAQELGALYQAEQQNISATLPPLALAYTDYTRWQAEWLTHADGSQLWHYWRQQLAGELPVLDLPTDHPRPTIQTYRGASLSHSLSVDLTQKLKALSHEHGATLYMTLLAAFQVMLHRYTGQGDILVGSPTTGRQRAALAGLVGYFINPVVLRADLSENPLFTTFLEQVKHTVLAAFAHQDYPFGLLVERLQPKRDPSRPPIFQTMFTLQQSPLADSQELASLALGEAGSQIELGGMVLESVALAQRVVQFDLALVAAETADGLGVSLQYNNDLFEAATISRMLNHFQTLLEGIATQPKQRLSDLPLLTAVERQQLLTTWNDTQVNYPKTVCLHILFESQVQQMPDAVAMIFEDRQLTYQELDRRANRLAHYLQAAGVGPDVFVGLCLSPSPEMLVGLFGILKAGGAYLPLDPSHPADRLAFMLADARVPLLLTQQQLLPKLPDHQAQVVCLDTAWDVIDGENDTKPAGRTADVNNLAYMIYTSGSTGRPKGVQISHQAVVNFMHAMCRQPGLTAQDTLLSVTTLSFDIAGLELFLPLTVGAKVVLVNPEVVADGNRLAAQLAEFTGTTMMQATPATWQLLLETGWAGSPSLMMLCGGEAFPRELANRLAKKGAALWNMYGPTETTIWSAICQISAGDGAVPIGYPIANTQIYLLDKHLSPVPVGVPGALYIGGDGLARGYFNRHSLTAEKFIPNPFSNEPGARLYYTGDLARYRPDGSIEFLGRMDHQVKIRGYRIELAEIEAVLIRSTAVQNAVVMAREDTSGDRRLVAYIVPDQKPTPTVGELRRFLQKKLPDYMVPSIFMMLEALPLTPNGKIDRRTLPMPEGLRPQLESAYIVPQTGLEQHIAGIWQKVLQVENIGIHDNFFELGGHSLLMAQIQTQLQETVLEQELTIVELFQYPTIHSLTKYLSEKQNEQPPSPSASERVNVRSARQTAMQQQRQQRRQSREIKR